ncbi:hypothetical protein SAY86_024089 [Trapa natans]|uniref:S1-like domain-containing protein n=1 Tax=Trapa natans TaxID=22666 RepID=A0AAN7R6C7_TRANT|nr:hypothetical protein SAY86_024089 [Trapa natans]
MATKGGRKNLQRATKDRDVELQGGESIVQVVSLRGSNLVEVIDEGGQNSLALFPAKFQKTMWIKRGNFIVVDTSGKEKAVESGSKVTCIVSRVLSYDQVRELKKSQKWPQTLEQTLSEEPKKNAQGQTRLAEEDDGLESSSEDDDLPPLEPNINRARRFGIYNAEESDSESESNSDS